MIEDIFYLIIGFLIGIIVGELICNIWYKYFIRREKRLKFYVLLKALNEIFESNKENFNIGVEVGHNSEKLYDKIVEDIVNQLIQAPELVSKSEINEIIDIRNWKRLQKKLLEIIVRLKKKLTLSIN